MRAMRILSTLVLIPAPLLAQGHQPTAHGNAPLTVYVTSPSSVSVLASDSQRVRVVPIIRRKLVSGELSIGGHAMRSGIDFVPFDPGFNPRPLVNAQVIYGGDLEDRELHITPEQARGRVVVFTTRTGGSRMLVTPDSPWSAAAGIITVYNEE